MEHDKRVATYLRQAAYPAIKIAYEQITLDGYAETIEAHKQSVPKKCVIEVEMVFQLAASIWNTGTCKAAKKSANLTGSLPG